MGTMDLNFHMSNGLVIVVPKVTEDEFKNMMEGWADPTNAVVGMPGIDGGMKFLARTHIVMIEVTDYVF
jgi:hypothetical protein